MELKQQYNFSALIVEYCVEHVCVCLSVCDHIFGTTHPIFVIFFCRVGVSKLLEERESYCRSLLEAISLVPYPITLHDF